MPTGINTVLKAKCKREEFVWLTVNWFLISMAFNRACFVHLFSLEKNVLQKESE